MKKIAFLLAGLLCLVALAGCGSNDMGYFSASDNVEAAAWAGDVQRDWGYNDIVVGAVAAPGNADYNYWGDNDDIAPLYDTGTTVNPVSENEVAGASQYARKVIRNAYYSVEANEEQGATNLYREIADFCNSLGGYEFSSDSVHLEHYSNVNAVLKVPPERFEELLAFIDENAEVLSAKVDSDDITAEYYDLSIRLETKRRSLESYYTLLENADRLDDIVSLQRTIDTITEEIEAVAGRLRVMDSLSDMATVTLKIQQFNEIEELQEEIERREIDWGALSLDDMGYLIRNGFISVVNVIAGFFQWVIIAVLVTSPVLVPVVIIVVIKVKRGKVKRAAERETYNRLRGEENAEETDKNE